MGTAAKRRAIRNPENIRQDPAGPWVCELVETNGGVRALERQLGWSHGYLHRLMRTPKVPSPDHIQDLARISGEEAEVIAARFGRRRQYQRIRTTRLIASVRRRFPRDPLRMAVVDHIEREGWTLQQHAQAVDVQYDTLRSWLLGGGGLRSAEKRKHQKKGPVHQFLSEPLLRKIAEFERLDPGIVTDLLREAEAHAEDARDRAHASLRKTMKRRKSKPRRPRPAEVRDRIADAALARWSDPKWMAQKGRHVIDTLVAAQQELRADEETSLAADIRMEIGDFRRKHRSAVPAHCILLLCRILRRHRGRFPRTALTIEDVLDRVESALGEPLHRHIHAAGRPRDVRDDIALIRRILSTPRPRRLFEPGTAERQRWNDMRDSFDDVVWYGTFEGRKRGWRDLLHFVAETIADGAVDMRIFRRDPGRPPGSALDEPEGRDPRSH